MSGEHHVTLDWGREKVHLASGRKQVLGGHRLGSGFEVEEALCGFVVGSTPREGTEDEVDAENVCRRCLKKRDQQEEAPR